MSSLGQQARKGLVWTLFESFFTKSFTFVTAILLTRILSPEEFGLIGLIMIFIAIGNALVEGGLGNSLIRDNESGPEDYSTVFYTNMLISVAVYAVLFFTAPLIANYFEREVLIDIIRVYGLILVITAFSSVKKSILMKELAFKKLTLVSMPGVFTGSATGLIMAYQGYGAWSLVFLHLVTQATTAVFIWSKTDWTPRWVFSRNRIIYHWNFGYKLMLSSVLNALFTEIYSVVIGKRFSVVSLGHYNRAKTYNLYPVDLLSQVVSKVSYPLLSKMKEDKEKVSALYKSILRSIFFIVAPLMLTLGVVAEPLFLFLFSEKWLPAVPYFQILTFSSILLPVHSFNLNVFKVFDRTDLYLKVALIKKVLIVVVVALGLAFGIYELLIGMVVASYIALIINTWYAEKLINYKTLHQLRDMAPTFVTAGMAAAGGWFALPLLSAQPALIQVIIVAPAVLLVYMLLNLLIRNRAWFEVKSYAQGMLANRKSLL